MAAQHDTGTGSSDSQVQPEALSPNALDLLSAFPSLSNQDAVDLLEAPADYQAAVLSCMYGKSSAIIQNPRQAPYEP